MAENWSFPEYAPVPGRNGNPTKYSIIGTGDRGSRKLPTRVLDGEPRQRAIVFSLRRPDRMYVQGPGIVAA